MAILTGHVTETSRLKNPHTNVEFIYAKVNSLGGEFDIVVDPEILNGDICVNGVVSGMFWLSGRVIDYDRPEKNGKLFLFRFFNKK